MKKRKKIVFIISNLDYSLGILWAALFLDKEKYEQTYIFLSDKEPSLLSELSKNGFNCFFIPYSGKKNIPSAFFKVLSLLKKEKADIVHTHLFDASLIGIFAARLISVPKRIYTRHHSTLHHQYFPAMVKYDRFINSNSTHIIAISQNVAKVLTEKDKVHSSKISIVNHGFDLNMFSNAPLAEVERLRKSFKLENHYPVIGIISRYTYWKGIQYIIPAFKELLNKFPQSKLILANAKGDYSSEIKALLAELPSESFVEIAFEKEVGALYALFDIFVHVPIDEEAEAFGQTYIESLAAGVPSVFTLSGISREFIVNRQNAITVSFKSEKEILASIVELLGNSDLRKNISERGKNDVQKLFGLERMKIELEKLYDE